MANKNVDFSSFAGSSSVQDARLTDPQNFDKNFPVTPQNQTQPSAPTQQSNDSLFGNFLNVLDNVTPDDMGGMVRGTSGWLSKVPGYQQTAGKVAGLPLSGVESVVNVVNWGSDQMNHLGAALISAAPGGIQTLDWSQSHDVSFGQAAVASQAINQQAGTPWLIKFAFGGPIGMALKQTDPNNVIFKNNFDILNAEDRRKAFNSGGVGQVASGFDDAIWGVVADPTIVGSKITAPLRAASKLSTFAKIDRFGGILEDQARLIREAGSIEEARKLPEWSAEGEQLVEVLQKNSDELVNHPWVKTSPNPRDTAALLGRTTIEDPETGAALAGALAGRGASWTNLRVLNPALYDDAARTIGVDVFSPQDFTKPLEFSDDTIALGDEMIVDAAAASGIGEEIFKGQSIVTGGSRLSPKFAQAAAAYRTGASSTRFESNPFKPSTVVLEKNGQWLFDSIQSTAASRPITVVRWLGQGYPSGVVRLDDTEGVTSHQEVMAWLAHSPIGQERSAQIFNNYVQAGNLGARAKVLEKAEEEIAGIVGSRNGLTPEKAMNAYESYVRRRSIVLNNISRSETNFHYDPEEEKLIKFPSYYAELDKTLPLLDTKMFNRVVSSNKTFFSTLETASLGADYVNSLWKISVLLRLGYTQRNIGEGAFRSLATLGMVATNPKAFANLPANVMYAARAKRFIKDARNDAKTVIELQENVAETRKLMEEPLKVLAYADTFDERLNAISPYLEELETKLSKGVITSNERKALTALRGHTTRIQNKYNVLNETEFADARSYLGDLKAEESGLRSSIEDLAKNIDMASRKSRVAIGKRKITGERKNVIEGETFPGAFQGKQGEVARLASSADTTVYETFNANANRRIAALEANPDFKKFDPANLKPGQMQTYWDEYTQRINNRMATDPIGRMILEDASIENIYKWLTGPNGKSYRETMTLKGNSIKNEEEALSFINNQIKRIDYEMPRGTGIREAALERRLTPEEVISHLGTQDKLPVIVGRMLEEGPDDLFRKGFNGIDKWSSLFMKWLGTIPENKILRHPFYSEVYDAKQRELYKIAAAQGNDMGSYAVKEAINTSAHRAALKATKETLYTIERFSNAGQMLRFVSPFFPAWENAIRTWSRIAYNNPAVVAYGDKLWNIPNNLGWVVDKDGNKIEHSNFLKDEQARVIWPEPIAKVLSANFGPFTPGESLITHQQSMNFIFPGNDAWFPGVGPMTQIPAALVLRGKPDVAEAIRAAVGDSMYNQLIPGGNPNQDIFDMFAPTLARRIKQKFSGETSDSTYLKTMNQTVEDMYIDAQLTGRNITEKDIQGALDKAANFWNWQILAAVVAPFQSSLGSKYQLQRDLWQSILDDTSLTYDQKLKKFTERTGGSAFLAITRSGSDRETKLNPNLKTWDRISSEPGLVKDLYAIDPKLVGMYGNMGTRGQAFSPSVYSEFTSSAIAPDGKRVQRTMTPSEIFRNNQVQDGWREYMQVKDLLEEKMIASGFKSLESSGAAPLKAILDQYTAQIAGKYPAWAEEKQSYKDMLPSFIIGARKIVETGDLAKKDSTVNAIAQYLTAREMISERLRTVGNDNTRNSIKEIGYNFAFALRQSDIGFADFYDQYLADDDFRKVL